MSCPTFPSKDPAEVEIYGIDLGLLLGAGETVTACTFTTSRVTGSADPAPLALVGAADLTYAPTVKQKISGGTVGNTYRIKVTATTSGGRTIVASALLSVREGAC